jgi:hypothetical protein
MVYDFPFTMPDVCGIIDLTYRYSAGDSIYVDCPVCSVFRKGKLNINFTKEQFRCNRCDVSGGMLDLYRLFGNANLSRSEARAEIIAKLNSGGSVSNRGEYIKRMVGKPAGNAGLADLTDIDYTYRTLLSMLSLAGRHANDLLRRGLTVEQIRRFNFRSVPDPVYNDYIIKELIKRNCTIKGVPGFYIDGDGKWTAKFSNWSAGVIIPTVGLDGFIHALQIRLDRPFNDGTKYIWFSSVTKEHGVSSGSPINFAGDHNSEVVYLTEGGLKAITAHCLSGKAFLGNQGVNHLCSLKRALEVLKKDGTKTIVVAYDNDKYKTIEVNVGYAKTIAMVKEFGFALELISWDLRYKGIDDFLLAQKDRKMLLSRDVAAA